MIQSIPYPYNLSNMMAAMLWHGHVCPPVEPGTLVFTDDVPAG